MQALPSSSSVSSHVPFPALPVMGSAQPADEKKIQQTKSVLANFLNSYPLLCVDGLRDVSFEELLNVLLLKFSLPLLASSTDKQAKGVALASLLKNKKGELIDAFFMEAPRDLKKGVICLKILVEQKDLYPLSVGQFMETPQHPDKVKTFKNLLSFQHELIAAIDPLTRDLKNTILPFLVANQLFITLLQQFSKASTDTETNTFIEVFTRLPAKMKGFFAANKYYISKFKKDCSSFSNLEIQPYFLPLLNDILDAHERDLLKVLTSTKEMLGEVKKITITLECMIVPSLPRLPESENKIQEWAQVDFDCISNYLFELLESGEFKALEKKDPQSRGKIIDFLKNYYQKKEAVALKKLKPKDFCVWVENFLSSSPSCAPFVKWHQSIVEKCLARKVTQLSAWKKEMNIPYNYLAKQQTAEWGFFENLKKLFVRLEASRIPQESFFQAAFCFHRTKVVDCIRNDISMYNSLVKSETESFAETHHTFRLMLEAVSQYENLIEITHVLLPLLKKSLPFDRLQREQLAKRAADWLFAQAVSKDVKKRERQARVRESRSIQKPVAQTEIASVEKSSLPAKEIPREVFSVRGLFVVKDLLKAIACPQETIGKKDLSPVLIACSDQAFHLVYLESALRLMDQSLAAKKPFHIPLLMSRLLNHLYLAQEQAASAKILAQDPEQETTHGLANKADVLSLPSAHELDFTTFWWRYLHSSRLFYHERSRSFPEGLSFLWELHNSKQGWPLERLQMIREGLRFFMDQAIEGAGSDEKVIQHIRKEKEELLRRFESFVSRLSRVPFQEGPSASFKGLKELKEAVAQEDFSKKAPSYQAAAQDLRVHLRRLEESMRLLHDFPALDNLGMHMINILTACQYIYEHMGVMISINQGGEIHTHNLMDYAEMFKYDEFLTPAELEQMKKVNLKKGSDYPHQETYKRQTKTSDGLKWLSEAYQLTSEAQISGSGFIPVNLKSSIWVKDPVSRLHELVETQVGIMLKIFKAIEGYKGPSVSKQILIMV